MIEFAAPDLKAMGAPFARLFNFRGSRCFDIEGIQHVELGSTDLFRTVDALKARGVLEDRDRASIS